MKRTILSNLAAFGFVVASACSVTSIGDVLDAGIGGTSSNGTLLNTGGTTASASVGGALANTGGNLTGIGDTAAPGTCALTPSRMPQAHFIFSAAGTPDGRIYLFGGYDQFEIAPDTAALVLYDPSNDSYMTLASLSAKIAGVPGVAFAQGKLVASDGDGLWLYDPSTNGWAVGKAPSVGYNNRAAATGPDGRVYFFGGLSMTDGGSSNHAGVYDPANDSWSPLPDMPFAGDGLGAATVGNKIYVAGPYTAVYDIALARWSQLPSPPTPRYWLNVISDVNGRVLAIGGYGSGTGASGAVEIFDPASGQWSSALSLPVPVAESAAATACSGTRVFVFGGDSGQIEDLVQEYTTGGSWTLSP